MKNKNNDPIDGPVSCAMSIGAWQQNNMYGTYDLTAFSQSK